MHVENWAEEEEITIRAYNVLLHIMRSTGCTTKAQLRALGKEFFLRWPNCGKVTTREFEFMFKGWPDQPAYPSMPDTLRDFIEHQRRVGMAELTGRIT